MPFVKVGWGKFFKVFYNNGQQVMCRRGLDENDRPNDGRWKMANLFNLILECSDCVWN